MPKRQDLDVSENEGVRPRNFRVDNLLSWNTSIAEALSENDKAKQLMKVVEAIKATLDVCSSGVFVFNRNSAPVCVFDEVEKGRHPDDNTKNDYTGFAYLLDPIYGGFLSGTLPKYCLMRHVAPDGFFHSEYYKEYYGKLGIFDEFYLNFPMDSKTMFHVTFTRIHNHKRYTSADLKLAQALRPLLRFSVDAYWSDFAAPLKESADEKQRIHDVVYYAFETFGASILTPREQEILQLMLKGFSDKSTARILEISPGTVRNHKKSIFVKLQVTSQGQVFGLFLEALANPELKPTRDDPPPSRFMR